MVKDSVEKAIRLAEYFLVNMNKAIKILCPETPIDRLIPLHQKLYAALEESFSTKVAITTGEKLDMKEGAVKQFLGRNVEVLFNALGRGKYEKMY